MTPSCKCRVTQKLWNPSIVSHKTKNPFRAKIFMNISFQLLLYIIKVKSQEDQLFCSLNFSDVMWKPAICRLQAGHLEFTQIFPLIQRTFKFFVKIYQRNQPHLPMVFPLCRPYKWCQINIENFVVYSLLSILWSIKQALQQIKLIKHQILDSWLFCKCCL